MPAVMYTISRLRGIFPNTKDDAAVVKRMIEKAASIGVRYFMLAGDGTHVPVRYRYVHGPVHDDRAIPITRPSFTTPICIAAINLTARTRQGWVASMIGILTMTISLTSRDLPMCRPAIILTVLMGIQTLPWVVFLQQMHRT